MSIPFEDPRTVLRRHGLAPKRSFSQNFLVSPHAVEAIVRACALAPGARVVELGPGAGTLTFALASTGATVHAIERDREMLRLLEAERGDRAVELIAGDAKDLSLSKFVAEGERIVVAGNLPYAITGAIFRRLYEEQPHVERAVVMIQREVRDRLVAAPDTEAYGALSVFTSQLYAIETVVHLPRTAFHPPPKVTSSVVRLTPLRSPRAPVTTEFQQIVRAAFQTRRKTLRNALTRVLGAAHVQAMLDEAHIDGTRRGETLSVEEFGQLAHAARGAHYGTPSAASK